MDTRLLYALAPAIVPARSHERSPRVSLDLAIRNDGPEEVVVRSIALSLEVGPGGGDLTDRDRGIVPTSGSAAWSFEPDEADDPSADLPLTFVARPIPPVRGLALGETVTFQLADIVVNQRVGLAVIRVAERTTSGEEVDHRIAVLRVQKVQPPLRIDRFEADPVVVLSGGPVRLSWETTTAAECEIRPDVGRVNAPYGEIVVQPLIPTVYTLIARGKGPPVRAMAAANVDLVEIVSFLATPRSIAAGDPVTLSWKTVNARSCTLDPGEIEVPTQSEGYVVHPDGQTAYVLNARGAAGVVDSREQLVVLGKPKILSFEVVPRSVDPGNGATLSWVTLGALSAEIDGIGPVDLPSGSRPVRPDADTTYVLRAVGTDGSAEASVTLAVGPIRIDVQRQASGASWSSKRASAMRLIYERAFDGRPLFDQPTGLQGVVSWRTHGVGSEEIRVVLEGTGPAHAPVSVEAGQYFGLPPG